MKDLLQNSTALILIIGIILLLWLGTCARLLLSLKAERRYRARAENGLRQILGPDPRIEHQLNELTQLAIDDAARKMSRPSSFDIDADVALDIVRDRG